MNKDMPARYQRRLIIFTRYPEAGTTKTRLIPLLGSTGAADLQRQMTEHTLAQVRGLITQDDLTIEIRYEGSNEHLLKNWLGPDFVYRAQGNVDLGTRMKRALEDAFISGANAGIIIGTDIPDITETLIEAAFDTLKQKNVVLGPARDGGYYLIGLHRDTPSETIGDLFSGLHWGTHNVLDKTLEIATRLGLSVSLLDELEDVDRPEDLWVWERVFDRNKPDFSEKNISMVMPALNEADNIAESLSSIGRGRIKEVIVVDGGSHDSTVTIAKTMGATVINSSPPRSRQLNLGATEATGDVLLFLHADTRLPDNFDRHILNCMAQPNIMAGAFELGIDSPIPVLRFIERSANWRSRHLKSPYGDQAIFMLSEVFHQAGGFPDIPIMEDLELIRRLRKKGKIVTLPVSVLTSPRRWQNFGILKTTLINKLIVAAYFMGISPETLARFYHRSKGLSKEKEDH